MMVGIPDYKIFLTIKYSAMMRQKYNRLNWNDADSYLRFKQDIENQYVLSLSISTFSNKVDIISNDYGVFFEKNHANNAQHYYIMLL